MTTHSLDPECIFCKIVRREMGDILVETKTHVVFLDINPLSRGHLLVIPKYHAPYLTDLPDTYLAEPLVLAKEIVNRLGTVSKFNFLQNNGHIQSVYHVHYHIIPYHEEEEEGLSINWNPVSVGKEEMHLLAQSYKQLLGGLNGDCQDK